MTDKIKEKKIEIMHVQKTLISLQTELRLLELDKQIDNLNTGAI